MSTDGNEIEIRLSESSEAEHVAAVLRESFAEYEALYTPQGFAATTPTIEQVLNRFKEGPVWVAVIGGHIVGTVSAVLHADHLYIRGMAVLPMARGKRAGDLLLEEIERFAALSNQSCLVLSTTPFLIPAIRLYQRHGFRRTDEGVQDLFGTPLFTMQKLLNVGQQNEGFGRRNER